MMMMMMVSTHYQQEVEPSKHLQKSTRINKQGEENFHTRIASTLFHLER